MVSLRKLSNRISSLGYRGYRRLVLPARARCCGLVHLTPEYWIRQAALRPGSVVADCGVGDDPHLSLVLLQRYGAGVCHLFDPTRKHHARLEERCALSGGKLKLHKFAIAELAGTRTFHETLDNVSGSLLSDHTNILHDRSVAYDVSTISLEGVFAQTGTERLDLLKLDIEGEEYPVLSSVSDGLLTRISQLIVEFHHYCVQQYSQADTRAIVGRLTRLGFSAFSYDSINYLFYRR